ncbi:hypothetical protein A3C98_02835 [Candidatus Roizmanbacteria bacterium RIFCSPHIGHO2_02_FULL_37_15]|uniref:Carbohydrate kinase PfkB domain-containing protein n=1 Tax=Candidatus Roizmanbacteria bacterium RIFCSPLOWO2_01_FULL_37_16 TaxID=1802058 RepID=A0A1F7IKG9_9BACT|nr:MAG: hypothetical protein A2859_01570 [Candidatus Roizmanbacteria bacterium RIFCSPHIGHO2_01_FULL_37_16b]OGK20966.1 MAG: hypothetical protein A3C98_02835 [Candidatus Roizmanbacteria bacterium RIFCSPHIGHO2_02_FULL_37_15]OGK33174.1 MAG: hypothetical protein A3F57_01165 [Candidatus Roizmanbacteria bacterium RIFCSPHIGHO2_12_FULL_36_11]OGK43858.1 MAG: hypothetical protein A3B40_00865 [Candidatus Roizmanbacteria bacterium RIFCSPLOWO2_01_FULL_37_16]OGK56164.1 MAG: hypothetical protein A3I50_04655 [C
MKNIILTGSLSFDYIFDVNDSFSNYILPDKIHQINFSFVIDSHHKSWGGTAANQAFYLARLDTNPFIFATGGFDFDDFNKFLKKNRVRTDFIRIAKNLPTGTGFVITDKKDNQIWMYSKGAMKNNSNFILSTIVDKIIDPIIVISPNEPKAIINFVNQCENDKIEFAFDPAFYIPTLPIDTLYQGVKNARIIFGNDYEIAFIEKRLKKLITDLVKKDQIVVKTLGDQGSEIFHNGKWIKIGIYKTKTLDPTGAGDAYRAGFLSGYLNNQPIKTCGWMGAVVASFAIEVKGTMNLKFTKQEFEKRLAKVI